MGDRNIENIRKNAIYKKQKDTGKHGTISYFVQYMLMAVFNQKRHCNHEYK